MGVSRGEGEGEQYDEPHASSLHQDEGLDDSAQVQLGDEGRARGGWGSWRPEAV